MKTATPLRIFTAYANRIRDRYAPLRKTEIDGIKFYYLRGNEPQNPHSMGQTREMYQELDKISGKTAIDVGAHIGSYALRLAKHFHHVIAFEPNPFNRHILKLNILLNRGQNVQVEDAALSDIDDVKPFYFYRAASGSGSLNALHYGFKYDRSVQVKVKKLDSFELPAVDVIKIDAEGYEVPVLVGAIRTIESCRPILAIEVHRAKDLSNDSCDCETCSYLMHLDYDLTFLGVNTNPPVHWVLGRPSGSNKA